MEILNICPKCSEKEFEHFLTCKDYTVSQTEFSIVKCISCEFKFTNPRPNISELGQYYKAEKYISHTNTKKGLINQLYHLIRNYTLIKKLQLITRVCGRSTPTNSKLVLDIGCGTGSFLDICIKAGFNCLGIEPDKDARMVAKKNYNIELKDEEELNSLLTNTFDVITLWHVLEHMPGLNEKINKIKELLKANGTLIIAVPNHTSFDAIYYGKFWAAYDLPRHLYHFAPIDIISIFNKHGMKVKQILPMRFDSFYVSILSENNKTGKGNYFKALLVGLTSNLLAIKTGNKFSSQIYIIKK